MEVEHSDTSVPPILPNPGPNNKPQDTSFGQEMKMMENRLKESLKTLLKETMNAALKPIQESICHAIY